MSFRLRLIVVSALAVATAIALVSGIVYLSVRRQLYSELRSSLQARAAQAAAFPKNATGVTLPPAIRTSRRAWSPGSAATSKRSMRVARCAVPWGSRRGRA